jgi:hypothetical protein
MKSGRKVYLIPGRDEPFPGKVLLLTLVLGQAAATEFEGDFSDEDPHCPSQYCLRGKEKNRQMFVNLIGCDNDAAKMENRSNIH